MEELFNYLPVFLLVFTRVSSFFVTAPLFSYRTIPVWQRLGIGLILAFILTPVLGEAVALSIDASFPLLLMKEAVLGIGLGMVAFIIMSAIQIAGGFIDFQMGFAIANVIDPQTGAQSPLLGQFFNAVAMLLLLAVNGHHMILDGIYYSYQFVPIDQLSLAFESSSFAEFSTILLASVFTIAFQMAIPVVATLFLVDLALGITARAVPQMNIFVVGFPIKITVSFLVLVTMIPVMVTLIRKLFEYMAVSMRDFMLILGGG